MVEFGGQQGDQEASFSSRELGTELKRGRIITPDMLERDNISDLAIHNRTLWQQNKAEGKMHAVLACGDARNVLTSPESSYSLLSIAAGGEVEPYRQIFEFEGVQDIIVITHYDSQTVRPGHAPTGCGGLGEKEKMVQNGIDAPVEGIQGYINTDVRHPDIIVQSTLQAQEITKHTNRPVAAATMDHRTGKLDIVAAYWRRGGNLHSIINDNLESADMHPKNYDSSYLYAEGIPGINPDTLPEEFKMFREYAYENKKMVDQLQRKYPNIYEMQKVQNPDTLILTTEPQPVRLRYPQTFELPGSYFKLSIPRRKDRSNAIRQVTPQDLKTAFAQAEYPITHAVKHHDDITKPFSKVGNVLIETGDHQLSLQVATSFLKESWMQDWLQIPGHHIIAAESKGGIANSFIDIK